MGKRGLRNTLFVGALVLALVLLVFGVFACSQEPEQSISKVPASGADKVIEKYLELSTI